MGKKGKKNILPHQIARKKILHDLMIPTLHCKILYIWQIKKE